MVARCEMDEHIKRFSNDIGTLVDLAYVKPTINFQTFNHPFAERPLPATHNDFHQICRQNAISQTGLPRFIGPQFIGSSH